MCGEETVITSSFPLCGSRGGRFRPWLTTLVVSLVALLAVGCGSSRDEFVFTGTSGVNNTGSMTFNFVQAQEVEPSVVPVGTTRLLFEFFDGPDQTGAKTLADVSRDFAGTITIDGIPTSTSSVRVTAFSAEGVPLLVFTANVVVIPGTNVVVALGQGTAVAVSSVVINSDDISLPVGGERQFNSTLTFSNGTVLANQTTLSGMTWTATDVLTQGLPFVTIDDSGRCTANAVGQSSITCSYGAVVSQPIFITVTPQSDLTTLVGILLSSDPDPASVLLDETITFGVIGIFESDDGEFEEPLTPGSGVFFLQDVNDDADDFLEFDGFTATAVAIGSGTVRCGVDGSDVLSNPVPVVCGELGYQLAVPADNSTTTLPNNSFLYGVLVEQTHPNPELNRILSLEELLEAGFQFSYSNNCAEEFLSDDDDFDGYQLRTGDGVVGLCTVNVTRNLENPIPVGAFDVDVVNANISSMTVLIDNQDRTDPNEPFIFRVGDLAFLDIRGTIETTEVNLVTSFTVLRGGSILEFGHCEIDRVDPRQLRALTATPEGDPPPGRLGVLIPGIIEVIESFIVVNDDDF